MICVVMSLYKNDTLCNVKKAVTSIINQTYEKFNLYIMFDGYVDKSIELFLKSISDNRIKIIEREINRGLAYSLNELLLHVLPIECEYIARMDADDISMPERFERQINFMEKHLEIDCLGTWAIEIDSNDRELFRKRMPVMHNDCLKLFKKRDCLIHPTVMFRKSYFEKAGVYPIDTYFGEDTMMWSNGFKNGCRFANLPEYLFMFRLDSNFYKRRRGWKHAKSIFLLRCRVNRMLHFGFESYFYAFLYALAKMMPNVILKFIYKVVR